MSRNVVVAALDRNDWKSLGSIAVDAGLSKYACKKFLGILESEGDVERSTNGDGEVVYRPTTRRR